MIKKLYAVCLLVQDIERSLKFYRDKLGLTLNSRDGSYADFKLSDTLLAIIEKNAASAMYAKKHMRSGGGCVLAYRVNDVEKACKDPDDHIWEITS